MKVVVVSLFDGLSGGRLSFDRVDHIEVLRYYSSEIDKYAIKIADKNYPQDIPFRLGDVTKVGGNYLRQEIKNTFGEDTKVILIGGSPCFVAGTKVVTSEGYKNIEDITVGDSVITHTNNFKQVLRVGGKVADTVIVKAQGIKPTETTNNHPYYVRSMSRVYDSNRRSTQRVFSEPKWVPAGDLAKGDFLGIPINQECNNLLKLTEEECYILGRYLADGYTRKDYRVSEGRPDDRHWQLILSIGVKKVENFSRNITENNFSCYTHSQSVHRVVFSNKRLVQIAEKYCGIGAINKVIPQVLLDLPRTLLSRVLDGYLDGDGSYRNNTYSATSISEKLIMSISSAVAKVYKTNSSYSYTKRPSTCIIEGRVVNQKGTYAIEFRKEMRKQSNAKVINNTIWVPFKEVISTGNTTMVYNIEVADANSYTANNAIVHNCQGFSMSGKLKGSVTTCGIDVVSLEQYLKLKAEGFTFDGQSYLFWEYVRIKQELQPTYFMLENVRIPKKWLPMFNEALGIAPIMINSALLSAQNRVRFYWHNLGVVEQPEDAGIVLSDVLEPSVGLPERPCELREFSQSATCHHTATALDIRGNESIKRIYAETGKAPTVTTCMGGHREPKVLCGASRGRYILDVKRQDANMKTAGLTEQMMEVRPDYKTNCLTTVAKDNLVVTGLEHSDRLKLKDVDTYRKLTPLECERLQTIPDFYTEGVSNSQRLKMIGNSWTIEVTAYIFRYIK